MLVDNENQRVGSIAYIIIYMYILNMSIYQLVDLVRWCCFQLFVVFACTFWGLEKQFWLNKRKIIRTFPTKLLTNIMSRFHNESMTGVIFLDCCHAHLL